MRKLYLDMRYVGRVPHAYRMDAATLAAVSGYNLGNFVFRHALHSILADFADFQPVVGEEFRALVAGGEKVEHLLVSCANWLGQTAQDEQFNLGRATMIESVDGPVTAFGLGVQAKEMLHDGVARLGPNTIRLARALSERCQQLSVRDELTRRTLEASGVQNAVVTGCPSGFINGDADLGAQLAARAESLRSTLKTWDEVRNAISEVTGGHGNSGKVLSRQMRMLAETPAFYVIQTPLLLPFILGDRSNIPQDYRSHNPFMTQPGRLTNTLKAKSLHFTDVDSWMDFSRSCDMSLGMRIHGTIVPLQAGTPSILVAHDSRTVGLADAMCVPWISPEEFLSMVEVGPSALYEAFIAKIAGYDANRHMRAGVMRGLVEANGLRVHKSLLGLT